MCAFVQCSTVVLVADNMQKFDHSSDIILKYLLVQCDMGHGQVLKCSSIGGDTVKCLQSLQWCVVGLRRAEAAEEWFILCLLSLAHRL